MHRSKRIKSLHDRSKSAYNKERDRMEKRHEEEMGRSYIVPGTLALVMVRDALAEKRQRPPLGCVAVPVIIENRFGDGRRYRYQVKANGTLLTNHIKREHLIIQNNDLLKKEIETSSVRDAKGMSLLEYCHACWMPRSLRPRCECKNGCKKTHRCQCRKAGFKCGTDCHPAYYKRHCGCSNYKDHTC